ncbi:Ig-like domain-containing protein, partial [Pseudomonas sp. 2822-17]|uniref:Ig-like domain-containing protein n=1 Tax=Pseudomonas sp. 2822-17 TaxID=1712678 RepID=UPI0015A967D0
PGKASVSKWPLSFINQRVWLTCSSPGVNDLKVLESYPINSGEAAAGLVNKDVARAWLSTVRNNGSITVSCEVTLDGSTERGGQPFPLTTYTVAYPPPLQIDQSTMVLNGRAIIVSGWTKRGEYPGNTQGRNATGGVPPYTYQSRNPAVASVTSTGSVSGMSNGSTIIDVTDRNGALVSYSVNVSNVWLLRENRNSMNWAGAVNWRKSLAGAQGIYFDDGVRFMGTAYGWPLPVPYDSFYWLGVEEGCDPLTGVIWDSLKFPDGARCINRNISTWAWCLQPS